MSLRLSICIATLNRAAYLDQTLESMVAQATDDVEIVVVDGASTDHTETVVRQYQERFPRLRYLKLEAKGGVDQDYCRAVALAQGEYCWLMTDDDVLKPGALAAVLAATRRQFALVVVNAEVRDADLGRVLMASRLNLEADRVYPPGDAGLHQLLAETGAYLSFIGGVVIQRALWEAREKAAYFGSEFIHVGVIFQRPLPGSALALAEPWVVIRYGNAQWTSRFFPVWMFQWPGIIWSFTSIPEAVRRRVTPREPWRRARVLFLFRARGAYGREEYQHWLAPRLHSSWDRLGARLVARLPGCAANLLARLYAAARRYHPLRIDLENSRFAMRRCWAGLFGPHPAEAKKP